MPPPSKPIAIYIRVSTSGQKFDSQEGPMLDFCKRKGWTAAKFEIFREKISGIAKTRPVLERIMAGARVGKIKTVVVYKLDRLGRSLMHLAYVVNEFKRMGVALLSVSEGIDTSVSNPLAQMQINMLGSFAELERDMIRGRAKAGLEAARKRGVKVGRPRTRDKFTAEAIAFKKKGLSLLQIAGMLKTSVTTVYRITKDCGLPKKVRGADKAPRARRKKVSETPPQIHRFFPGEAKGS